MKKHIFAMLPAVFYLFLSVNSAASPVAIEWWTTQTQSDRIKTIRLIIDTFEALHPDIRVGLVPVDENAMASQMAAASAAGNMPDLIEGGSTLILAFAEEGILDERRATAMIELIRQERFYRAALDMLKVRDKAAFYAVPFHGWMQGIWYRKDWFENAGLSPPDTWENIRSAARSFHKPENNQYGILLGTTVDNYTEQCFTHLALSQAAAQFDRTGALVFNSDRIRKTLKFYQDLAMFTPPGPQTWRAREYYFQGRLAMFFYSTYIMDDLAMAEADTKKWATDTDPKEVQRYTDLVEKTGVVTTITAERPAGYGVVVCLGLLKTEDQKKARAVEKFVSFLFEPVNYITFLHMSPGGMNPMLRDVAVNPDYLNDPMGIFARYGQKAMENILSGFDAIGSFAVVDGRSFPVSGKISAGQIIPQMIFSVVFEHMNPDDAVDRATKEMQKMIRPAVPPGQ